MTFSRALEIGEAETSPMAAKPDKRASRKPDYGVFSNPVVPISTAFAVAILTLAAISFGRAPDMTIVVWVANAVAICAWVRAGRGLTFDLSFGALVGVGILAGEFLSGYKPPSALLLTAANLFEIVVGVLLLRRMSTRRGMSSVNGLLRIMAALAASAILGGLVGAASLYVLRGTPFLTGFQVWTFGHALGLFIVGPMLLALDRKVVADFLRPIRLVEGAGLIGGTIVVAILLSFFVKAPLAFLLNPLLLIIAVRFGAPGVGVTMLVSTCCMLGSILYAHGPLATADMDISSRIVLAQLTLTFACVPYLIVAALMGERDRLAAQARAGQARAERASEAKSRLLANVAHEIKSPVGGVIGIGEMWASGRLGPVDDMQREMADMVVKTARQVETLAHDLLDVACAEAGTVKVELRPTEVVGLVEDVRRSAMLRPEADGVVILIEAEEPSLVARADSQRLRQVVDNLMTNALKYGRSGGSVVVTTRICDLGVRIEVADKGAGLSLAKQAQLFEPFNRLGLERSTIEGHGVGLALARRLIELQGGEIGVISAPGEGATFWVELPSA